MATESDVICHRCGSVNDYTTLESGPHLKATCNGCDRYIKFISREQHAYIQNKSTAPVTIAGNTMIKLQIIGHLGKDAVLRDGGNGQQVIGFSVAHTEKFKKQDGTQTEKTTWVECSKWVPAGGSTAIVPYLTKGAQVYVEGAPTAEAYVNKEGQPTGSLKCTVFQIQLLGSAQGTAAAKPAAAAPQTPPPPPQFINNAWVTPQWNGSAWVFPGQQGAAQPAAPGTDENLPF